jgi:prepilin peptidase CpaA
MIGRGWKNIPRFFTGGIAMTMALYFIYFKRADLIVLSASFFLFLICVTDTLYSKIPNLCNFLLIILGFGLNSYQAGFAGTGMALLGLVTGLGLFLVPFLLGGMGAGDVKALAALGALLGPGNIFQVFLYTAIFGGMMGVLHYLAAGKLWEKLLILAGTVRMGGMPGVVKAYVPPKAGKTEPLRFPYAAAIAFGFFAFVHWGGILNLVDTINT